MRVLLSTVPLTKEATYGGVSFAASYYPPIGLAYIGAVLEKAGHEVCIVDCFTEGIFDDVGLRERVKSFDPDFVGIQVYTPAYSVLRDIVVLLKSDFPKVKIVVGGPHASNLHAEVMLENPLLDYLVVGEGEYTFLDLVNGKDPKDILGLVYRINKDIVGNGSRPFIEDLDELPHPARHLLPSLGSYKNVASRSTKGLNVLVMSSRGCPFNCYFCSQNIGRKWRGHSVDYIFDEIDSLGVVDKIDFLDDNFCFDKIRLTEFCRKKIEKGYSFSWNCMIRLDAVDEETIKLMKDAGCDYLFVGVESGDDGMLKFINKNITTDLIREKVNIIKKVGVKVHGSLILGYPKDTRGTIEKTIGFLLSLPLDSTTVNLFTPFPGTRLTEIAKDYGKVSADWGDYSTHSPRPPFVPNGLTAKDLLDYQKSAYRKFYFRPSFILKSWGRVFDWTFLKTSLRAVVYFVVGK